MITRKRRINRPNERQEKTVLVLLIAFFLFALLNSSSVMCYTAETIEHFWRLMVSTQNEQSTTVHHKSYSKSWTTSLLDDMWWNTEGRSRSLTVFPPPLHCLISITKTDCVSFLRQKWTFYKFNRFKSMHIIQRTTEENNMRRGDENRTDNFRKSARTRYYQRRWWWDRKRDEWEQLSRTFYSMKKGRVKRIHWNPR